MGEKRLKFFISTRSKVKVNNNIMTKLKRKKFDSVKRGNTKPPLGFTRHNFLNIILF